MLLPILNVLFSIFFSSNRGHHHCRFHSSENDLEEKYATKKTVHLASKIICEKYTSFVENFSLR